MYVDKEENSQKRPLAKIGVLCLECFAMVAGVCGGSAAGADALGEADRWGTRYLRALSRCGVRSAECGM